jgi:FMN phosphatase YigB (HAD superfamily)
MSLAQHETEHGRVWGFDLDNMLVVTRHNEKLEHELEDVEKHREVAQDNLAALAISSVSEEIANEEETKQYLSVWKDIDAAEQNELLRQLMRRTAS